MSIHRNKFKISFRIDQQLYAKYNKISVLYIKFNDCIQKNECGEHHDDITISKVRLFGPYCYIYTDHMRFNILKHNHIYRLYILKSRYKR